MLLPFSPSMSAEQYAFFKAEAELPGITRQFISTIVGGLLRKPPQVSFKVAVAPEVLDWIKSDITIEGGSLVSCLNDVLNEELQTSRAWLYVDYPKIEEDEANNMDNTQWSLVKPYVVLWQAESIINWKTQVINGKLKLSRVVVRGYEEVYEDELALHPKHIDTIWVHELVNGVYQIRKFTSDSPVVPTISNGDIQVGKTLTFTENSTVTIPKMYGANLTEIPAFPVNGSISPSEPFIASFVNKEQSLYNVMARRNHLLFGAATYTPWISSDMPDKEFEQIVNQGLGTWIRLRQGDGIGSLAPPTESLKDLETTILNKLDELAKLGIRFLAPETAESGVALTIRSATQIATLGALNTKVGETMSAVIAHMVNRRFNSTLEPSDVVFNLSPDFDPTAIGEGYLRLATEWYSNGLIPRDEWVRLLKANEMLSPEYDDKLAIAAINADEMTVANTNQQNDGLSTAQDLKAQLAALKQEQ
jgi:hypothetical protein